MTDVEDTVRKFPHITREFLQWQADPGRRRWPNEMSEEYREAKEAPRYAPHFTTMGRMRDAAMTVVGLYGFFWLVVAIYEWRT